MSDQGFTTRAVHGTGESSRSVSQSPTSVPIYQTSTWGFGSSDEFADVLSGERHGYAYGRGYGNPTVEALEAVLAALEGTESAFAFSSGMSAIHAVCTTLASPGGRIVASRELYGGTYSLFHSLFPRYGITVDEVDVRDLGAVEEALPGAALFYCETISNPSCTVADLESLGRACRAAGVPAVVDNTFASPYLCNPARYGFDYVVHSVTKMIAGHSDVIGGALCSPAAQRQAVQETSVDTGGAMGPFDAWLCIRGVETLELRMERMCANASALVALLERRPEVSEVRHPGLPSHPDHELAARLLRPGLSGSVFSFELAGGLEAARRWCDALDLAWIGASLGGTHTLVCHPASTTHRQVPPEQRLRKGLTDGLVRVSPGIENTDDLVADFDKALGAI